MSECVCGAATNANSIGRATEINRCFNRIRETINVV